MTEYAVEKDLPVHPTDVGRPMTRTAMTLAHLVPLIVLPAAVWRTSAARRAAAVRRARSRPRSA